MSLGHFTNLATLICAPVGVVCRYEWAERLKNSL